MAETRSRFGGCKAVLKGEVGYTTSFYLIFICGFFQLSSTSRRPHSVFPFVRDLYSEMFIFSQRGRIQTHPCREDAEGKQSAKGLMT